LLPEEGVANVILALVAPGEVVLVVMELLWVKALLQDYIAPDLEAVVEQIHGVIA
jgi:hypothetical protein